jgi:Uri superfamily endonuclease
VPPPTSTGTYVLVLRARRARTIAIGRFGSCRIEPGYYAYVGSAFGPGGLRARLAHHRRRTTHPRWHIDYLRVALTLEEIWFAPGRFRRESLWARTMVCLSGATIPIPGFGASDHRGATHLVAFARRPQRSGFVAALARAAPGREAVARRVMAR